MCRVLPARVSGFSGTRRLGDLHQKKKEDDPLSRALPSDGKLCLFTKEVFVLFKQRADKAV